MEVNVISLIIYVLFFIQIKGVLMVAKKKTKFMCQSCGYESPKWMGKCPGCGEWNKMVEEVEIVKPGRRGAFSHSETQIGTGERVKPTPITTIETEQEPRIETDLKELNRVLGGGIVQGSLVLIGGDPGIGKSTLLITSILTIST